MTLLLDESDVCAALDMGHLIDAVQQGSVDAARGAALVAPRVNLGDIGGFLRMMGAMVPSIGAMGFKVFNGALPGGVRYLVGLYSVDSHELLALLDSAFLTAARTGATTGVATRWMAAPGARTVGVIGAGLEARTNLLGVCRVRDIESVTVFSPTPARRERFAAELTAETGVDVSAVGTAEECVDGVDIVVVATNTSGRDGEIAFRGRWMSPGQHVNSIGSTMPVLRECDADTFARADRLVLDVPDQARHESGDLMAAAAEHGEAAVAGVDLGLVAAGQLSGRRHESERTVFKSVGSAMQDVCAAWSVYEQAKRLGLGKEADFVSLKPF